MGPTSKEDGKGKGGDGEGSVLPRPLAGFKGSYTSTGREERGKGGRGGRKEGEEERRGRGWVRAWKFFRNISPCISFNSDRLTERHEGGVGVTAHEFSGDEGMNGDATRLQVTTPLRLADFTQTHTRILDWVSFRKIITPKANRVNLWHTSFLGILKGAEPKSAVCRAQDGK